jgi:hypothetical protein
MLFFLDHVEKHVVNGMAPILNVPIVVILGSRIEVLEAWFAWHQRRCTFIKILIVTGLWFQGNKMRSSVSLFYLSDSYSTLRFRGSSPLFSVTVRFGDQCSQSRFRKQMNIWSQFIVFIYYFKLVVRIVNATSRGKIPDFLPDASHFARRAMALLEVVKDIHHFLIVYFR